MSNLTWFRKLVLLCFIFPLGENRHYSDGEINRTKQYMGGLCRNFKAAFQQQMQPPRNSQYGVLTMGPVNDIPPDNFNFADLPFQTPRDNWNAWYTGLRNANDNRHMEEVLLNSVRPMLQAHIDRRIAQRRNQRVTHLNQLFPKDMYLYTYLVPCPECTYVILDAVNTNIPNILNDILSQLQNSGILSNTVNTNVLLSEMTFWLGWTSNERGTPAQRQQTFTFFNDRQITRPNPTTLNFRHVRVHDDCTIPRED